MDILALTAPVDSVAYPTAYGTAARRLGVELRLDADSSLPTYRTPDAVEEWFKSQVRRIPAIGMAFPQNLIVPFPAAS